jgi:hypothetical protein
MSLREEFAQRIAAELLSRGSVLGLILLVWIVVGFLSLRFLARLPEYPGRAGARRGAGWGMALLPLLTATSLSVILLGVRHTYWPMTAVAGGLAVWALLPILLVLCPALRYAFCAGDDWLARRRQGIFDPESWILSQVDKDLRLRRWRPLLLGLVVALVVVVSHTTSLAVRYDRGQRPWLEYDEIAKSLSREVTHPQVICVNALGPPLKGLTERALWINLRGPLSPPEAEELVERLQAALRARQEPRAWRLDIRDPAQRVIATGRYEP